MARRKSYAKRHKAFDLVRTIVLLAGVGLLVLYLAGRNEKEVGGNVRLMDGDSLFLGDVEIRLLGIDAPEGKQNCARQGRKWSCGRESARFIRKLIAGKEVRCKGWKEDKYGRLLAICHAGDIEINQAMVKNGWAVSFGDYEAEEAKAEAKNLGIWSGEFDFPQDWRRKNRSVDHWSS